MENIRRQVGWLWKHRHTHDDVADVRDQLTIIRNDLVNVGGQNSQGAFVHLVAGPQEIPSGGAAVEWQTAHTIPALNFFDSLPSSVFTVVEGGYYDLSIELGWDSYVAGGRVWVVRTRDGDVTVWPPASTPGSWLFTGASRRFEGLAPAIPCLPGDSLSVWVDHLDGDPQQLNYASAGVYLVDRGEEPVPPPDPPQNVYVFTTSGTFDWAAAGSPSTLADVWIIGGGAGGSKRNNTDDWVGGGGGAGGVLHLTNYAISGDVGVVVGNGGVGGSGSAGSLANGVNGNASSFDGQIAPGGGFGAIGASSNGDNGGCGGGGGAVGALTRTGGTGSDGGDGGDGGANEAGGGGGGAGGDGENGSAGVGGDGGPGIDLSAIVGTVWGDNGWFAGGGGATGTSGNGAGGQGGGGAGTGESAIPNSGGGGGAGPSSGGGNGAKGIVIVKVA